MVQDRLPTVLERAEETLQTLRDIVARMPASLDRSDRFFTSVERIMREGQLPELSADLRKFATVTSEQIAQVTANLDRLVGPEGNLVKFAEEARSAIRDADVAKSSQAARDAADRTSLAADDLRRALPAIREALEQLRDLARRLEEQPESVVYGPRKAKGKS
jgi:methyl-accepting chemotaxis protein